MTGRPVLQGCRAGIHFPAEPIRVNETFVLYVAAPLISGLAALFAIFAMQVVAPFPPALFAYACSVALIAAATGPDRSFSRGTWLPSESTRRAGGLPADSSRMET